MIVFICDYAMDILSQELGTYFLTASHKIIHFTPIALRKAKIVCNFGLSECNRVNRVI